MIFSQGQRFKKNNAGAICPCKCVEFWDEFAALNNSIKGPRMVPDYSPHNHDKETGPGQLYPDISPVRPRAGTTKFGGGNRFGMSVVRGKDSPGATYSIPGIFDHLKQYRDAKYTTFGAGDRGGRPRNESTELLNTTPSYNFTQKRAPGALVLGRFENDMETDVPGPGQYNVRRELSPSNKGFVMRPDSPKALREESRPGYYNIAGSLVRKTHNHTHFSLHEGTCQHRDNHDYCCRNCCILCQKGPSRTKISNPEKRSSANAAANRTTGGPPSRTRPKTST